MCAMPPPTLKKRVEPDYSPKPVRRTMRPTVASITRRPATPSPSKIRGLRSAILSTTAATQNPKSFTGNLKRGVVTFPD
jgi:hypothetical protein